MNKKLIFILIVAFLLRFFKLGEVPFGVSRDEASLGYNAYSVLKTGKDEYGQSFPLAFKAFGEYKAPLYIYLTVPFIALFDLNEFAIRLPGAILGISTVMTIYSLVMLIVKKKEVALACAFFLAVIPWHLQFSRIAYEGTLTVFLVTCATYFFVKSMEKGKYLIISGILFVLTFYSHYSVRAFIPLYLLSLGIFYFRKVKQFKKEISLTIFVSVLLFLPILPHLTSKAGLLRASYISFTTDQGLTFAINEKRAEHIWNNLKFVVPTKILHNKATEYSKKFVENYISHFDLSFLFIKGDEDKIFTTPHTGLLLFTFLPLLFIGMVALFREKSPYKWVILSWLFLAPLASSLTRLSASSNRAFIMVIPISIVLGLGLVKLIRLMTKSRFGKYVISLLFILIFIEYISYLDNYYVHLLIKNSGDARVGSKELVTTVNNLGYKYDQIWVTNKSGGYIHFLFYLKYPPEKYQKEASLGPLDEFGFGSVLGFDKYKFDRIPKYFDFSQNILFVASFNEEPKDIEPIKKIYNPDGLVKYVIFDTQSVKTYCALCSINSKPDEVNIYGDAVENIQKNSN